MSSSFIPSNAFLQAVTMQRRKPYPYVKDDEEIPLEGMQQVQTQSQSPQELPITPNAPGFSTSRVAKSPLDAEIIAPPQNRIGSIPAGRDMMYRTGRDEAPAIPLGALPQFGQQSASGSDEIPLGNTTTVQPLSKEQEIDLAPIPESDKTREGYQNLYNAGTSKPQMPDHSKEHHGFLGDVWQHLRHAGKGALIGALLGSRAGGGGVLGGALAGGLTGAISPKAADTMEYNAITEPKWEHDNQIAQEEAGRKAGIAKGYEQEFGTSFFDPTKQTESARMRTLKQRELEQQNDFNNTIKQQQQTTRDRNTATAERRAKTAEMNLFLNRVAPNTPLDQINQAFKQRFGEDLPSGFDPHKHELRDTGQGFENIDKFSNQSTTIANQATGTALPSPKGRAMDLREQAQAFNQWRDKQSLGIRREALAIQRNKGQYSPEAVAYQEMVDAGKVDPETGMADNPAYDLDGTKATFLAIPGTSDEQATAQAKAYLARKKIVPKIAASQLPDFKGAKIAAKARRSQPRGGQSAQPVTGSITQDVYDAMVKEKGEARTKAYMAKRGLTIKN